MFLTARDSQERNQVRISYSVFGSTLIQPIDGTPPLVRVHSLLRPTTTTATHYAAVAATIVRIIAESATALARHKAGGL
jgi:hypothetical protein